VPDNKNIYEEIIANALEASGARFIVLTGYEAERQEGWTEAWGGLNSEPVRNAFAAAQRIFPALDPWHVTFKGDINEWQRKIYIEGKTVEAPFLEMARGFVPDLALKMVSSVLQLRYSLLCPIVIGGNVVGGLTFHTSQPFTAAVRRTCDAFARQVALTLENELLLRTLRAQVDDLKVLLRRTSANDERIRRDVAELLSGPVQQRLNAISVRLGDAAQRAAADLANATSLLDAARTELDELRERELRSASQVLHPSVLNTGLVPSLRSLAAGFRGRCEVTLDLDPRLARLDEPGPKGSPSGPARIAVYRVVEEALSICVRSGGTSAKVGVALGFNDDLELAVSDDGHGLDAEDWDRSAEINSLAARVGQVGGRWRLFSSETAGTTFFARLPLQVDDANPEREGPRHPLGPRASAPARAD